MYYAWQPGKVWNSNFPHDDEFFISRVKKRERFNHAPTQVKEWLDVRRKILWWVPIGEADNNGQVMNRFDAEVFNVWSYLDTWGNWSSKMGPAVAAFADVCHKNGVTTATTANIPWATDVHANSDPFGRMFDSMMAGGTTKFFNWLKYYGNDGYGLNSEFNFTGGYHNTYINWINSCFAAKDANGVPNFAHIWYGFMSNSGGIGGSVDMLSDSNSDWFHKNGEKVSQHYMTNYHWSEGGMASAVAVANKFGRSSFDAFQGSDIQGWDFGPWHKVLNYPVSLGFWGEHKVNMVFAGRAAGYGPSSSQKQKCYRERLEGFFSGGTTNPVNTPPVTNTLAFGLAQIPNYHGMCSYITAKSVLQGSIAEQPFVSYFNLGNGTYFNENGVTTDDSEWYNIGMQDYLPTWRYWLTSNWLGKNPSDVVSNGLKAEFTYEDAWFGGSCMKISGATSNEYLHLFKTKYPLLAGDKITVRYKVLSGAGNVKVAGCVEGNETTAITPRLRITKTSDVADSEWKEYTCAVGSGTREFNAANQILAVLGLQFSETTEDFEILIGEMSLARGQAVTPKKPVINTASTTIFKNSMRGVDFRLVYSMQGTVPVSTKLYNIDVDTWFYKIYVKQEGKEPRLYTATTSWAAFVAEAEIDLNGSQKVQLGVAAVALDGKSQSEISWTEVIELPEKTVEEGLKVDKTVIKANQNFTVSFKDSFHPAAKRFEVSSHQTGEIVATFTDVTEFTMSLPDLGIYNVNEVIEVDVNGKTEEKSTYYYGLIQISTNEVGSMPEILTLTANNSTEDITVELNEDVSLKYTGNTADGSVSRGLALGRNAFVLRAKKMGLEHGVDDYTFSFWMKVNNFSHQGGGTSFLNINESTAPWFANQWGRGKGWIRPDNQIFWDHGTIAAWKNDWSSHPTIGVPTTTHHYPSFRVKEHVWNHYAWTFHWVSPTKTLMKVWINGKPLYTYSTDVGACPYADYDHFRIGGSQFSLAALDANIDEVKFYKRSFTEQEMNDIVMKTTAPEDVPESLVAYYNFEEDVQSDNLFDNQGSKAEIRCGLSRLDPNRLWEPVKPQMAAGAPFIAGKNYVVETKPRWYIDRAKVVDDPANSDVLGTATAQFTKEGQRTVRLVLSNDWGQDVRDFEYVNVGTTTDVDDNFENVLSFKAYPNPFQDQVAIQFAKGGDYALEIYDLTGKSVYKKNIQAIDEQFVTVDLNAPTGVYLLKVASEGKLMKVLKLVKK